MAALISSFTEADVNKVNAELAQAWVLNEAINWSVAAYDYYLFYKITATTVSSDTVITGTLSNGDKISIKGSGLTTTSASISQIDYTFVQDEVNVSLFGNVSAKTGVTSQTGFFNKVTVSSVSNGLITVTGFDDVAVATGRTVSSVTVDFNGVSLTTSGSLIASTSTATGEYVTSFTGNYTASTVSYAGHSLQLTNITVPGSLELINLDTLLSSALSGPDAIIGSNNNDYLVGFGGNDTINGSSGIDTVFYSGTWSNYTIVKSGSDYTVTAKTGIEGIDTLRSVERLQFDGTSIALDIDGNAGQAYRVYQAAFDRKPDLGGLGFWINSLDQGSSLLNVAANFVSSAEFKALYGTNVSNIDLVTRFYANVLHRAPEKSGFDFWVGVLNSGATNAAEVLKNFSESPENQLQVIGQIQNGFEFTKYVG